MIFQFWLALSATITALSLIPATDAATAVLFGANGAVGNEILHALLAKNDFYTKVILVGRRPLEDDVLSSDPSVEVVQIVLPDFETVDQHEELTEAMELEMEAGSCFIADSVDIAMDESITRMCGKLFATTLTVFTAIDADPNDELETKRVMGLKERAVVDSANEAGIPWVRIFQPSNIVTAEPRYSWRDFHSTMFDSWLPTRYHSVTTTLLATAMVEDAVAILSGTSRIARTHVELQSTGDLNNGIFHDGATRLTYGDFLCIARHVCYDAEKSQVRGEQADNMTNPSYDKDDRIVRDVTAPSLFLASTAAKSSQLRGL